MIDHGHRDRQRIIHPGLFDVLRELFATPAPIDKPPAPRVDDKHADITDYMLTAKRADAIRRLGRMWRGRADCEHTYTNSDGDTVRLPRRD